MAKTGRRKRPSIWAERKEQRYARNDPNQLSNEARQIIAAVQCCNVPEADVAEILGLDEHRVELFLGQIRRSRHPAVILARDVGLPMSAGVDFPEKAVVRCMICRNQITCAPCVRCWLKAGNGDEGHFPRGRDKYMPASDHPTLAAPGSREKIEVMRRRVAAGCSPFCADDKQQGG